MNVCTEQQTASSSTCPSICRIRRRWSCSTVHGAESFDHWATWSGLPQLADILKLIISPYSFTPLHRNLLGHRRTAALRWVHLACIYSTVAAPFASSTICHDMFSCVHVYLINGPHNQTFLFVFLLTVSMLNKFILLFSQCWIYTGWVKKQYMTFDHNFEFFKILSPTNCYALMVWVKVQPLF